MFATLFIKYKGVALMTEKEIQFGEKGQLAGSLSFPETSPVALPAILIIAGSGPLDRNGNGTKKGQMLHLYNQLAAFLTECGFVVLRYDKRGTGKSSGDFIKTGFWDLIDDAKAAVHFLRDQPIVDRNKVFILGHSEGCMLAPEVAKGEDIQGLIFVAGAAQSLADAQNYQRELIVDSFQKTKGLKGKLIRLLNVTDKVKKQGQKFDRKVSMTKRDVIRYQGVKINAKWFREHYEHDVYQSLAEVTCPILAVTGSKDVQATPNQVYEVKKYTTVETETHIIKGMNHMLRDQDEDANILHLKKVYKSIGEKPLSKELLTVVKSWLDRHV
jgi:alpha/beta superfamily hydrolase